MRKIFTIFVLSILIVCLGTMATHAGQNILACDSSKGRQMVKLPALVGGWQIVKHCDKYESKDVATAISIFYFMWAQQFGDPDLMVRAQLEYIMIEWGDKARHIKYAYNVHGRKVTGATTVGLTLSPSYIWVYQGKGENSRISSTSLIHELVHVSIWAANIRSHGDPDHEGHEWPGWIPAHTKFIKETNDLLVAFDL